MAHVFLAEAIARHATNMAACDATDLAMGLPVLVASADAPAAQSIAPDASAVPMDIFQMELAILAVLIVSTAFLMELAPPAPKHTSSMVILAKLVIPLSLFARPVSVQPFAPNALVDSILLDMESTTHALYAVLFRLDAIIALHQLYAYPATAFYTFCRVAAVLLAIIQLTAATTAAYLQLDLFVIFVWMGIFNQELFA
jgi:hypothetical protein